MRRLSLVLLLLAGCSGVADLSKPAPSLAGDERAAVARKSDQALKEGKYSDAWELEVHAGGDRARLEAIALVPLKADEGPYEEMFAQLVKKFGGVTPKARTAVDAATNEAEGTGRWKRAADIQIAAADDAPAYKGAWAVYDRTPPSKALEVLDRIHAAREALLEALPEASATRPK
jgi:hypothetical protein